MSREIDLARECGAVPCGDSARSHILTAAEISAFAARIRQEQLEVDAQTCDDMVLYTGLDCAAAIRAGGNE